MTEQKCRTTMWAVVQNIRCWGISISFRPSSPQGGLDAFLRIPCQPVCAYIHALASLYYTCMCRFLLLEQWFSTEGEFASQGNLAVSLCHTEGCHFHAVSRGWDGAKHPAMHRRALHHNCPVPNVRSDKTEWPWAKQRAPLWKRPCVWIQLCIPSARQIPNLSLGSIYMDQRSREWKSAWMNDRKSNVDRIPFFESMCSSTSSSHKGRVVGYYLDVLIDVPPLLSLTSEPVFHLCNS